MKTLEMSRVAPGQWHALEDDLVVGRGVLSSRLDGRMFVSVDAWQRPVFERLAEAMLAALPRPLYTVVDEADADLTGQWLAAGFAVRRREWEYLVPTAADDSGPGGVTILGFGRADESRLQALDRLIHEENEDLPAEIVKGRSMFAVAEADGEYAGLLRVATVTRRPRIGLVGVRAGFRRRGIARALLAHTLGALHHVGREAASAEVSESNLAATRLFEGFGARRVGSSLELVIR